MGPERDMKQEIYPMTGPGAVYIREERKIFSKNILKDKIEQFKQGKYSEKYIRIYLDYNHLENIISNLEYLEFKEELEEFI